MPFIVLSSALTGVAVLVLYLSRFAAQGTSLVVQRLRAGADAAGQGTPGNFGLTMEERAAAIRARAVGALTRLGGRLAQPEGLPRRLKWAGITWSAAAWQALPYPLAGIGAVLGGAAGQVVHRDLVPLVLAGGFLGALWPSLYLTSRLGARKSRIAREILTYAEYLAMAIKAGADFRVAVDQVEERFPGPVAEAFTGALVAAGIGGSMDEGLRRVEEELDNPDAHTVINTLSNTLTYGAACADHLVNAVQSIRKERTEKVMEKAGRSAVLLLLPTVVFVMPVVFLLVVFPMLHSALAFIG